MFFSPLLTNIIELILKKARLEKEKKPLTDADSLKLEWEKAEERRRKTASRRYKNLMSFVSERNEKVMNDLGY